MERGLRSHTILSYRDTIKLYLKFLSNKNKKPVYRISLNHFTVKSVLSFLEDAEVSRGNSIKTRNQRLAVLKSLYLYLLNMDPTRANEYEKIFHLKAKKLPHKPVVYLLENEMRAILKSPDISTDKGLRDYAMLLFLYNSGARAQEVCDILVKDVRLEKPYLVNITGKGQKQRQVPLWQETVDALKKITANKNAHDPVFANIKNQPLTRYGVRYLIKYYASKASKKVTSLLDKKIGPHTVRHTTAMHLLQSGVDITIIKSWLGHVDLNTTHGYVEINLKMMEDALAKNKTAKGTKKIKSLLTKDKDIVKWLEDF